MNSEDVQKEAQRLHDSEINRRQVKATTVAHPDMTIDDAYQIQNAWKDIKLAAGREIVGHKIGLTSRTMQKVMGIDEPDFGFLLDDMVFQDGDTLKAGDFLDPKLEVELAFILKDKLEGDNLSIDEVLDATEYICPALELIAARSFRVDPDTGRKRTVKDTISDNAANAGIILGKKRALPREVDLKWVGAMMARNEVIEESGVSGAVLNHPAHGVSWLARKYSRYDLSLEPGHIILSGSFTRPVDVRSGDDFFVDFNALGSIRCSFS